MAATLFRSKNEIVRYWVLTRMLLSERSKISFRRDPKQATLKIVSGAVVYALLVALGWLFYGTAIRLGIFSLLSFVPESVPSLLSSLLIVISFFSMSFALLQTLYFSADNRLILTLPCRGSTLFLARLTTFFLSEYLRAVVSLSPFLVSYMVISGFPWYMFLWFFFALFLFEAVLVLLASFFSIPLYYVVVFFKKNGWLTLALGLISFGVILYFVIFGMRKIPDRVDIFANWGPYFSAIQSLLKGYRDDFPFLNDLTVYLIGSHTGFVFEGLLPEGRLLLYVFLGSFLGLLVLALLLINPLYRHIASESLGVPSFHLPSIHRRHRLPFGQSQLEKEELLLLKSPGDSLPLLAAFLILPFGVAILDKFFGAMDTTSQGNFLISTANLLIILLVALNANAGIARMYSEEGRSLYLSRSYPRSALSLLLSKLVLPFALGAISLFAASSLYGQIVSQKIMTFSDNYGNITSEPYLYGAMPLYFLLGLVGFYGGHMLFSASLDFSSPQSSFVAATGENRSQLYVSLSAFALSFLMALLFYLFLGEGVYGAHLKIMVVGLVYFLLNVVLFLRKAKFLFEEADS